MFLIDGWMDAKHTDFDSGMKTVQGRRPSVVGDAFNISRRWVMVWILKRTLSHKVDTVCRVFLRIVRLRRIHRGGVVDKKNESLIHSNEKLPSQLYWSAALSALLIVDIEYADFSLNPQVRLKLSKSRRLDILGEIIAIFCMVGCNSYTWQPLL